MKKLTTIILALILLLSFSAALSSCGHECEFSTEWSQNDESHWHACTHEGCTATIDEGAHEWKKGKITIKPTQENDGIMTYTCKTCLGQKSETVAFEGYSRDEWDEAFASHLFDNFSYEEIGVTSASGVSVTSELHYKFTRNTAWCRVVVAGQASEEIAPDAQAANDSCRSVVQSIRSLTPYDSYTYDAKTKTYKATKPILLASLGVTTDDVTLTFEDDKLVSLEYSATFVRDGTTYTATSTVRLFDYDNTFSS